ncbi:cupin domain-containing protein [Halomonas sp. SpR8]|uniref:cupin domain-containing protein n=1 Tax=Halomonas sp. SpR8 TaxID=3050463 RepID=UPI0027E4A64A|nr:cupin domain-containing protein [Halomonas sp. SpR8]MDQ7727900.1 cupin domain-containing protein [Halomonas sp. SpR8]
MQTKRVIEPEQTNFSGMSCDLLVTQDDAEGLFNVIEMRVAPQMGAPLHISFDEYKFFKIIGGSFEFYAADEVWNLQTGDSAMVKKGDKHGFKNIGETMATIMLVSSPSRHVDFFKEMAALATPHDPKQVMEVCERNRQQLLVTL